MEKPRTKRFLEEFRSTLCRFDSPTAVIIPVYKLKTQQTCLNYTKYIYTTVLTFGVRNIFLNIFERSLLSSPRLHLFHQKYSEN